MNENEDIRSQIFHNIPTALLLLQRLEMLLEMCCMFLQVKGIVINSQDLLSRSKDRRGPTLGRMLKALKNTFTFDPDFENQMEKFAEERNWLVHRLFLESAYQGKPSVKELESINSRLMFLLGDTQNMTDIFWGLYHKIGQELYAMTPRKEKADTSLLEALFEYQKLFTEKLKQNDT